MATNPLFWLVLIATPVFMGLMTLLLFSIRRKLKNQRQLVEHLMEGVVVMDSQGATIEANRAAKKMFGQPELLQQSATLAQLAFKENRVVTDSITLIGNPKTHLDLIAIPQRKRVVIILQDKSSQHQVVEVGKGFIANASHELRTPITIIKGFAETLQDLPTVSSKILAEITEKIVKNCVRMETLVKSLLTLSDIEYVPESNFSPTDLVSVAENCRYLLTTLHPEAHVECETLSHTVEGQVDSSLIELCLMNLLENGVKYSPSPAHLTIQLNATPSTVTIAVHDRGMGIPDDDLPHVFDRFYTVDKARSRRLGGAGLGLSIVKTVIEKHAGTVSVSSTLGQGTTFTLTFPKKRHSAT